MLKELILFSFCSLILNDNIFSLNLKDGGYANQFETFQDGATCYAKDEIDQNTGDSVVTFT